MQPFTTLRIEHIEHIQDSAYTLSSFSGTVGDITQQHATRYVYIQSLRGGFSQCEAYCMQTCTCRVYVMSSYMFVYYISRQNAAYSMDNEVYARNCTSRHRTGTQMKSQVYDDTRRRPGGRVS